MKAKDLALRLAYAETELEVVNILKSERLWDDYTYWHPFGDNDNNFSTIGNQQSRSDTALVEKLINAIDAILMKECLVRGVAVDSPDAPKSMAEAMATYFGVRDGQLANLDTRTRSQMAQNIILAATGKIRGEMNLVIADRGEGQTPETLPGTILSLSKNNKLRVPFVQGTFNMGGTGILPFCGQQHFQLVISRRCPDIENANGDPSFSEWAFTIVRREDAREGRRSTMYTYLTDRNQKILRFRADALEILPTPRGGAMEGLDYGTYFKLFNYILPVGGYKSNILNDFNYRMAMLMPDLAHPIRLKECRPGYSGHSLEATLAGLQTRLTDDRANNIEDGFPTSEVFDVDGQAFRCSIYVFKRDPKRNEPKSKNYREHDGILYVINGQTHACIPDSFFKRSTVNLSYLADSILVLVDCSAMDVRHREDMFMNSRDRLRACDFTKEVEDRIRGILRDHPGLKKLQSERRAAAVQERLSDDRPLQAVLQSILSKDPVLSKLLISGDRLSNPFNTGMTSGTGEKFVGKRHPTFFTIIGKVKDGIVTRSVPENNQYYRLQFETDVENDFFARPVEPGSLRVSMDGIPCPTQVKHLGLYNGVATLDMFLPVEAKAGDRHAFKVEIVDEYIAYPLECDYALTIAEEQEHSGPGGSGERKPRDDKKKGDRPGSGGALAMPKLREVRRDEWEVFGMAKESALVLRTSEEGSDYFLNMDNQYLLIELKSIRDNNKIALTNARYKYSMALIGMGVESYYKAHKDEDTDVAERVAEITQMIAPILIPMIESMSDLDLNEI